MNKRIENAFEAVVRIKELDREIAEINSRMKTCNVNSIGYNRLSEDVDRRMSEFLKLKHALQVIKMPYIV